MLAKGQTPLAGRCMSRLAAGPYTTGQCKRAPGAAQWIWPDVINPCRPQCSMLRVRKATGKPVRCRVPSAPPAWIIVPRSGRGECCSHASATDLWKQIHCASFFSSSWPLLSGYFFYYSFPLTASQWVSIYHGPNKNPDSASPPALLIFCTDKTPPREGQK